VDERITYAAGGQAGKGMARSELERLIREARRIPVERDTLYRPRQAPPAAASLRPPAPPRAFGEFSL